MGNEVTQPEATKGNNHFWFANFHLWWRGLVVGGRTGNEVTLPEAATRYGLSCAV